MPAQGMRAPVRRNLITQMSVNARSLEPENSVDGAAPAWRCLRRKTGRKRRDAGIQNGEKRHLGVSFAPFRARPERPRCAAAFDLKLPQLAKDSRNGFDGFRAGFPVFAKSSVQRAE
jgi:hypothetical protein